MRVVKKPWVALVGPEVEENLSLRHLASALAADGVQVELYAFNGERDFSRIAATLLGAEEPPLVVGLSLAFQWRAHDFMALAMKLREGGYRGHVTAGGHFATFATEELLREFPELDSICRFEAEETLVELVRALASGGALDDVLGLALRRGGEVLQTPARPFPDVDRLPPPDRRGEPARCFGHAIMPLVGSRGCYGHCSFCSIATWHDEGASTSRFRLRDVAAVADEMADEHRRRGIEIFVFQDDDFFLPRRADALARVHALADALEARGVRRFATVVKARPNDVDPDVFRALVDRLHCLRAYVGIETDADQGLRTLGRRARRSHNRRALKIVRELGLYICFNLLLFDPDTTLEHLEDNLAFIELVADYPFCVGRVELYAGTPLLARIRAEGRCRGDFMGWDYRLADEGIERVFRMFLRCLAGRNYGDEAPVVQLWLLRFDIEACRFFHPEAYRPAFTEEGVAITRRLSLDSLAVLRALVGRVRSGAPAQGDEAFAAEMALRCRTLDRETVAAGRALAEVMSRAVGRDASLCEVARGLELPRLEIAAEGTAQRQRLGNDEDGRRVSVPSREVSHE